MVFITIQEQTIITGSDDVDKVFYPNNQFDYTDTEMRDEECECGGTVVKRLYYKVECDEVIYWVSSTYAFVSTVPIDAEDQCTREKLEGKMLDDTSDVEPLYKKLVPGFISMKHSYSPTYRDAVPIKKEQTEGRDVNVTNKNPGK